MIGSRLMKIDKGVKVCLRVFETLIGVKLIYFVEYFLHVENIHLHVFENALLLKRIR